LFVKVSSYASKLKILTFYAKVWWCGCCCTSCRCPACLPRDSECRQHLHNRSDTMQGGISRMFTFVLSSGRQNTPSELRDPFRVLTADRGGRFHKRGNSERSRFPTLYRTRALEPRLSRSSSSRFWMRRVWKFLTACVTLSCGGICVIVLARSMAQQAGIHIPTYIHTYIHTHT